MAITRLLYFSENQIDPLTGSVVRELSSILSASHRNNKPLGLTGALVFDDLWFLQALEGNQHDVWKTFHRIRDDKRHSEVVLVGVSTVADRIFGNWWMGLVKRDAASEHVFAPYLKDGRLQPQHMNETQILGLMMDLTKLGVSRELAAPATA